MCKCTLTVTAVLIIFRVFLQTVINLRMLSIGKWAMAQGECGNQSLVDSSGGMTTMLVNMLPCTDVQEKLCPLFIIITVFLDVAIITILQCLCQLIFSMTANDINNYRRRCCYHLFKSTVSVVQRPHDFFLRLSNLARTQKRSQKAEICFKHQQSFGVQILQIKPLGT